MTSHCDRRTVVSHLGKGFGPRNCLRSLRPEGFRIFQTIFIQSLGACDVQSQRERSDRLRRAQSLARKRHAEHEKMNQIYTAPSDGILKRFTFLVESIRQKNPPLGRMAWQCSGATNKALVDNLQVPKSLFLPLKIFIQSHGIIRSLIVYNAMSTVDRGER
jgi:hypothetical protein